MNNSVVVLGGSGMLGSMVTDYMARDSGLSVVATEINYCLQVGHPEAVMDDLANKVTLASMLPTELAAATHASMALAAHAAKQTARRDWLWAKATLYCPAEDLLAQAPGLATIAKQR